jgi:type III restriction enzyme
MLRRLDYQDRVLETLDAYLDLLKDERGKAAEIAKLISQRPDLEISQHDFAAKAWERMKAADKLPASRRNILYSPRLDGTGRPVPDVVLKVPTGGGKTLLAVNGLSRIFGRYLNCNTGFGNAPGAVEKGEAALLALSR